MEQVIGFFQVPDPFDQHAALSPRAEADSRKAIWKPLKNDPIHITLNSLVISLATSVWNDMGCHYPRPVYMKSLLRAMRASRLLVHEHPLLILCINGKPISEHSPDFIVQGMDTLIVNILIASTITQANVNCVRACVNAHRRAAGGVLINFNEQCLSWMNIIQRPHKYYRSNL
jgi:hypothetical protein